MSSTPYSKIIQVSLVASCFVVGFTVRILFEFLAVIFSPAARLYAIEVFRHGIPVGVGIGLYLFLQFHPKTQLWMREVVTEVCKVVWPTKKDTLSMTLVVCVILILSGVVLGLFDLSAGAVMKFIMN